MDTILFFVARHTIKHSFRSIHCLKGQCSTETQHQDLNTCLVVYHRAVQFKSARCPTVTIGASLPRKCLKYMSERQYTPAV